MANKAEVKQGLRDVMYGSFPEIFSRFRELSQKGSASFPSLLDQFSLVGGMNAFPFVGPYVQNNRVKGIGTSPIQYSKDEIAKMLSKPQDNEVKLRQAAHSLDWASYTFHHIRRTYSNLLTYHNYITPDLVEESAMDSAAFWREYRLADKLRKTMKPDELAKEASGKVMLEGKVFYTYRINYDKPRNRVNHAFYQQLPSDWVKIIGFNNVSKYTLAFDMMYFTKPGTDILQFPQELFENYLDDFASVTDQPPVRRGNKIVFAEKTGINMRKLQQVKPNAEVYNEQGRWYYWVTLPVDRAFTIEADDATPIVAPPLAGLFIALLQFADLEKLQLSLYQNPLIGFVHGEIPYFDTKDTNTADQYKLSNAGRQLFTALWNILMAESNTGGIPIYFAPVENMKLETFNEVSNVSDIVTTGNKDVITQAGLSGIIPASDDTRAGAVQVSLQIESKFLYPIYQGVEKLMNCAIQELRLNNDFSFHMFGDLYEDAKMEDRLSKEMTLGILPATIMYNALHDRSILDDLCWSHMIEKSGIMDKRLPLVSTYSARAGEGTLPPHVKHDLDPGGRPGSEGITSEGQEADADAGA